MTQSGSASQLRPLRVLQRWESGQLPDEALLSFTGEADCGVHVANSKWLRTRTALGLAHRDIKMENILVSYPEEGGKKVSGAEPSFKLGDFGSMTREHSIDFDKASKQDIGKFLTCIEEQCTRMYRAPEMLDQWQGFNVTGPATDMWMLGCVLYVLCTGNKHPF